jgi:hypothetical protein
MPSALRKAGDLNLEVLSRDHDPRPHSVEELLFFDVQAVGFQQGQKQIKSARAELDRSTVGGQLPPAQQHAKTPEFETRVGRCRARPIHAFRQRVFAPEGGLRGSIRLYGSPSPRLWRDDELREILGLAGRASARHLDRVRVSARFASPSRWHAGGCRNFPPGSGPTELAPLADPATATVAAGVGLEIAAGTVSPERVANAPSGRRLLLVLDN